MVFLLTTYKINSAAVIVYQVPSTHTSMFIDDMSAKYYIYNSTAVSFDRGQTHLHWQEYLNCAYN